MTDPADNLQFVFLLGALLVVLGLVAYLGHLLLQLHRQNQVGQKTQAELDRANQSGHEQRMQSIELIALAAIDGDCDLSEACIRVKKLLDYYPNLASEREFRVIAEMYDAVKTFDTHDARAVLPRREKQRQDRQRAEIERRYRETLIESFRTLRARMQAMRGSTFDVDVDVGR